MGFIAVHVDAKHQNSLKGAGFHKSEEKYRKCLIESTQAGNQMLKDGKSALDAVVAALEILENDGITNCGRGAALNLDCAVECDASVMQSKDLNWASIGSVSNLKNPILAAKQLLLNQQKKHPDNLMNPCFLAGDGAKRWAIEHGCLESNDLVTDQSLDLFEKKRLEISKLKEDTINLTINEQFKPIKKRKLDLSSIKDTILIDHEYLEFSKSIVESVKKLDTVGAIAIDNDGNIASSVSSGGIMFKDCGRIGQAAVYGAGVWAEENVAVSTSGVGEYLIKTIFAKRCASKLLKASKQIESSSFDCFNFNDVIKNTFIDKFLNSKYLRTADHDKLIGILSLVARVEIKKLQLIWAHNTPSMFIAYATSDSSNANTIFSRNLNLYNYKDNVETRSLLIDY